CPCACRPAARPRSTRPRRSRPRTRRSRCTGACARCGTTTAAVDPAVLPILACPRCHTSAPFADVRTPRCSACGFEVPGMHTQVLGLIAGGREPTAATAEQRFMESELVARMYDRFWRPTFVRLLAGKGAGAAVGGLSGELFIHKHSLALDDRPGPWLDLSCGPGAFVRALAAPAPRALVVGLAISPAMLHV